MVRVQAVCTPHDRVVSRQGKATKLTKRNKTKCLQRESLPLRQQLAHENGSSCVRPGFHRDDLAMFPTAVRRRIAPRHR